MEKFSVYNTVIDVLDEFLEFKLNYRYSKYSMYISNLIMIIDIESFVNLRHIKNKNIFLKGDPQKITDVYLKTIEEEALNIDGKKFTLSEFNQHIRKLDQKSEPLAKLQSIALKIRLAKVDFLRENRKFDIKNKSIYLGHHEQGFGTYWNFRYAPKVNITPDTEICRSILSTSFYGVQFPYFICPIIGFKPEETSCCEFDDSFKEFYCCVPKNKFSSANIKFYFIRMILAWVAICFSLFFSLNIYRYCKKSLINHRKYRQNRSLSRGKSIKLHLKKVEESVTLDLFQKQDVDKSGYLDKNEIKKYMDASNEEDLAIFMEHMDTNNDGRVDYEEFKIWISKR